MGALEHRCRLLHGRHVGDREPRRAIVSSPAAAARRWWSIWIRLLCKPLPRCPRRVQRHRLECALALLVVGVGQQRRQLIAIALPLAVAHAVKTTRHRDALEPLCLAEQLSPNDPLRFAFLIARAQAHYQMGEPEPALELAERAVRLPHAHAQIEVIRIACLVKVGREADARQAMAAFRVEHPGFTQTFFGESHGFARDEDLERYLEALESVGLPR